MKTGTYTDEMARLIMDAFYGEQGTKVAAMVCVKNEAKQKHVQNDMPLLFNALVGRLLSRKEAEECPRAQAATKVEHDRLALRSGTL